MYVICVIVGTFVPVRASVSASCGGRVCNQCVRVRTRILVVCECVCD